MTISTAVAAIGFHSATSNAPIQTPANGETSTCRVVIASTIASNGGSVARARWDSHPMPDLTPFGLP